MISFWGYRHSRLPSKHGSLLGFPSGGRALGRVGHFIQGFGAVLAGFVIVGAGAPGSAWAGGLSSATVRVHGEVNRGCSITAGNSDHFLDLSPGARNQPVFSIVELCDSRGGYDVTVTTANGRSVVAQDQNGDVKLHYVTDDPSNSGDPTSKVLLKRNESPLAKSYAITASGPAGGKQLESEFSDTILVQVSAK